MSLAFERGLGLGWIANTGNEADLNALEVMTASPGRASARPCSVMSSGWTTFSRSVAWPRRDAGRDAQGRSLEAGARAAASHTGALATEDRVVDAALRQLGIVRADDIDELLDLGDAFEQPRRPAGPRVAVDHHIWWLRDPGRRRHRRPRAAAGELAPRQRQHWPRSSPHTAPPRTRST